MIFAAAVVVYNVFCGDSPTCKALEGLKDPFLTVLIYDNSTADYGNRAYCEERGWVYLGGSGNMGISKAYNACLSYLTEESAADMLCLFDDDTHITDSYFAQLKKACENARENIFVPLIYAANKLVSPCILDKNHRVTPFREEKDALSYEGEMLSAINSCMAIRRQLFADFRYDENIFLDGVDHNFILQMRQRGEKIKVFPYRCDHAFSGTEKPPVKSALVRFSIYARDYRYILGKNKLAYYRLVGKRALHLTAQYKTPAFLKALYQAQILRK